MFRYEFSTGSLHAIVGAGLGLTGAAISGAMWLGMAWKEYWAGNLPAVVVGVSCAAFVGFCAIKMTWDWFYPKKWSIELTDTSLSWKTPTSMHQVKLDDIEVITLVDSGDSKSVHQNAELTHDAC